MNLYSNTSTMVRRIAGDEELKFDSVLRVKQSPHTMAFDCWGVRVSPSNVIYLMDGQGCWHELKECYGTAKLLLLSVQQRLSVLHQNQLATTNN